MPGWQCPDAAIANLQVEIRCDQVCKDQSFRGDKEDHAPPAETMSFPFALFQHSDLFTMRQTHSIAPYLNDTPHERGASVFLSLSTFQAPTNNSGNNQDDAPIHNIVIANRTIQKHNDGEGQHNRPVAGAWTDRI